MNAAPLAMLLAAAPMVPAFEVMTADEQKLTLAQVKGRAWVFWYEGPDTAELNDGAKVELTALFASLPEDRRPRLVAVGDVSSYDFWPARGFAGRQLRTFERKYKHPIYGDWSGSLREGMGFRKNESNLLFVDAEGKVLFHATGKVTAAQLEQVKALVRGER